MTRDLVLPEELSSVCVRKHDCSDHIEKFTTQLLKTSVFIVVVQTFPVTQTVFILFVSVLQKIECLKKYPLVKSDSLYLHYCLYICYLLISTLISNIFMNYEK